MIFLENKCFSDKEKIYENCDMNITNFKLSNKEESSNIYINSIQLNVIGEVSEEEELKQNITKVFHS